ncbi:MAG: hypothetical protein ABS96_11000 [Lysobacteraceae bacterium SCN 69-123]|jgi:hypothetical protein|nr:DUF6587 family protein [Stenotrophomonas acidaminiphila]ODU45904.1 MAG: hypothetical protein ABS96_11000 [Xanthomonadaceae bacterium SCN 69-123]OJY76690.1 MAG: hypothetical protein BGP18_03910 [Stenotrophomonas sp. 69-14]OZB51817.1 MAG: hypothetical protein B7X38_11430 [Stenotrophomonas sp. 14-69-23]MBN8802421.1 hypothetical protein [Stenotrophomonas acidaminiphila]MDF9440141.1 hypothetical protein [Stenotrophomonas acidaminiphila]
MDRGLLLQYAIIALAVLASAWVVLKKQFPGTVRRLRGALVLWLVKPQRSPRLQALGRRLAPPAAGGDDGCGGCGGCGPNPPRQH